MKKNNIFVTGARGFVGRNIVEYLQNEHNDKYKVFFPYHKELELTDAEKVEDFISKNRIDHIIHCASVGGSRKTGYDAGRTDVVGTNLRMFFNLVKAMKNVERMIHFGSGAEYDKTNYLPKMKESYFGAHIPKDDYGFSKYVMAKYIEKTDRIVDFRLFGVFGKYEDYEFKFISNSIVKNLLKLPIVVNQNVNFDFLYIDDLVRIVEKCLAKKLKFNTYNLTTGRTIDLLTIAKKINAISDHRSEITVRNPGLNVEYSGDNSRLMREISHKFTPFNITIKELYGYYASILQTIDRSAIEKDEYIKYCMTKKGG